MTENEIGDSIVSEAIRLHRATGPGLLESVYEAVLAKRLENSGLTVQRQVPVSFTLEGLHFDEGFRLDLLVESRVIVDLKSVETLRPVHQKQVLTYLRLSGCRLGYLLNFGDHLMKHGIHRIIDGHLEHD